MKKNWEDVLVYRKGRKPQQTIRKYYLLWRKEVYGLIERCDNPECPLHYGFGMWLNKPINFVLDHKNGVNGDNRPKNLQLLCPNCNSQQLTNGGRNKGKVKQSEGGFGIKRVDGKMDYTLPAETGKFKIS